ncbi:hypothetical protein [Pseudonocardia sp. TRM90224]|uniref:hypothetical protein n=1 Tax=Pseudonocardia sp. TRM90224 TaxID=2812678 RepID=UPI001E3C902B|nr:hypothetical protein [Pseudonocardia sp. TRM90224]
MRSPIPVAGLLLAAALLTGGCTTAVVGTPTAAEAPGPAAPPTTASTTGPTPSVDASGRFPAVLSTMRADTAKPVTADELTGKLLTGQKKADGFIGYDVVVASGLGSFRIATPGSYTQLWRAGTPSAEFLAAVRQADPAVADRLDRSLSGNPNGSLRAVLADVSTPGRADLVLVTLGPIGDLSGESLAAAMRQEFSDDGHVVDESHAVQVNGGGGAYLEFTQPVGPGDTEPRVGMQVRILDPGNEASWAVTCDATESRRADIEPLCADVARSFVPLPRIAA